MNVSKICLVVAMLSVGAAPVSGGPPTTKTRGPSPRATGSRPTVTTQTTHGRPRTTTHGSPKTIATTHGSPKTTTTTHSSPKTTTKTHGNPHKTAATAPTSTGGTTPPTTPLNPIAQKIQSNHGLQPKVNGMLPTGMTLDQASLGFKNQGQFIAALHVSRNLGIPFADLKTAMTGIRPTTTTSTPGPIINGTTGGSTPGTTMSLGQAIKKLRPTANATTATATAEHQATVDTTAPKKKNGK